MASPVSRACVSIVVFALTFALSGCARPPHGAALPRGSTVLALGDSLTFGTGATPHTSYPAFLATITGWDIVNAGVPGETAAQGCERLQALLEAHRPRLVLVLLGGNDFLRRMPDRGVTEALNTCVAVARAADVDIALLSVPRFSATGIANATLYEEAGRSLQIPILDAGLATLLSKSSMRSDAIHLNATGYREMALTVATGLRKQGWLGH